MSESDAKPPLARPPIRLETVSLGSGLTLTLSVTNRHVDLSTYNHRDMPGNVTRLTIFELTREDLVHLAISILNLDPVQVR